MSRIAVIGAGPMGLAAAYQAAKDGHQVDVFEAGPVAGGTAAHFDFGGLSLERFYHFVCRGDRPTFELLAELGIADKLRWVPTSMGFYLNGKVHSWGDPFALLRLPQVSLLAKIRYGLFALSCIRRRSWSSLDNRSASEWTAAWCGKKGYELFWRPLLDLKFYELAGSISAAWLWGRIRRTAESRKSIMQEELGYIEGGSETLVVALVNAIVSAGGKVHLKAGVREVVSQDGQIVGVNTTVGQFPADHVLSTVPMPYVTTMIPGLPVEWKERYDSLKSVGICCAILKLRRPVSPHFWVNISDPEHEIPGVIEFSNLRPLGPSIVYVPYYMPRDNPKFSWTDEQFTNHAFACLQRLNPALVPGDLLDASIGRLRYAQPVCDVGFAAKLPSIQTPIAGLQVADTSFYYPEDRSIAESAHLGRRMAKAVTENSPARLGAAIPRD
ncbi:MAG TPA: NAD(P)/FAD-dependent oxidoreductase [Acidobacteriaceae bacterium]|nr:NAD(P)/FAD-dependent oxidoreductase [Acidobacteriaceae bacterium]